MKPNLKLMLNGILLGSAVLCLLGCSERIALHPALTALPSRLVWAWERKEDLRWLPPDVGVAYVATAIMLEGDAVRLYPRSNPMYVGPETALVPVVHVDASWRRPPALSAAQQAAVVDQVLRAAASGKGRVVQLDFEVRRSQRDFLRNVVAEIRRRLPGDTALSVTALASWCAGDYWIAQLPADEIVPMAFRMGRDEQAIRNLLATSGHFLRRGCKDAIGEATDEPIVSATAGRHYYFSPTPWTEQAWQRISKKNQYVEEVRHE